MISGWYERKSFRRGHWRKGSFFGTGTWFAGWLGLAIAVGGIGLLGSQGAWSQQQQQAQQQTQPAQAAPQLPDYPRINLSTWYEVDPNWPQRPTDMPWGACPGVAVDKEDRVWVYTRAVPPIQVYSADGEFLFAWGQEVFGALLENMSAHQIKFDSQGNVWLCDVGNHIVLQLSPRGKILRILGTPGEPGCDATHFNMPTDMAISPSGEVFVADGYGNSRVAHFDANGQLVREWGSMGVEPGQFSLVHAIVMDSKGWLYVADRNNARVQVFDRQGRFLAEWRNLMVPWGFWISPEDEIWICGCSPMPWRETDGTLSCPPKDQMFARFDRTGRMLQLWTIPKGIDGEEKPGELNWVHGIALDSKGNIYAGDIIGKRVQKFVRQN